MIHWLLNPPISTAGPALNSAKEVSAALRMIGVLPLTLTKPVNLDIVNASDHAIGILNGVRITVGLGGASAGGEAPDLPG